MRSFFLTAGASCRVRQFPGDSGLPTGYFPIPPRRSGKWRRSGRWPWIRFKTIGTCPRRWCSTPSIARTAALLRGRRRAFHLPGQGSRCTRSHRSDRHHWNGRAARISSIAYQLDKELAMIRAFRSHPCVSVWTLQNETSPDLSNPPHLLRPEQNAPGRSFRG